LCLPGRKTCSHDQEHQNDWEFSECHYLITLTGSYSSQKRERKFPGSARRWRAPFGRWPNGFCRTPRKRNALGRTCPP
jgi:hypothetical protein